MQKLLKEVAKRTTLVIRMASFLKYTQSCQEYSRALKYYPELARTFQNCQELPEAVQSCQELSRASRNYSKHIVAAESLPVVFV